MNVIDRLRELVRVADPNGLVSVRWIAELLAEAAIGAAAPSPDFAIDMTVPEVARALNRAPSTIRTWLGDGTLEGYRMRGSREWRVGRDEIRKFQQRERERHVQRATAPATPTNDLGDLSAWRRHRGRTA